MDPPESSDPPPHPLGTSLPEASGARPTVGRRRPPPHAHRPRPLSSLALPVRSHESHGPRPARPAASPSRLRAARPGGRPLHPMSSVASLFVHDMPRFEPRLICGRPDLPTAATMTVDDRGRPLWQPTLSATGLLVSRGPRYRPMSHAAGLLHRRLCLPSSVAGGICPCPWPVSAQAEIPRSVPSAVARIMSSGSQRWTPSTTPS